LPSNISMCSLHEILLSNITPRKKISMLQLSCDVAQSVTNSFYLLYRSLDTNLLCRTPPNSYSISSMLSNLLCRTARRAKILYSSPANTNLLYPQLPLLRRPSIHLLYSNTATKLLSRKLATPNSSNIFPQNCHQFIMPQAWDTRIFIIIPNRYYQFVMPQHATTKLYCISREVSACTRTW
jgi:hypothetical protein